MVYIKAIHFVSLLLISMKHQEIHGLDNGNIALGKVTTSTPSLYKSSAKFTVDGNIYSCVYLAAATRNYVILDLGSFYQVSKIRLRTIQNSNLHLKVYLGNSYQLNPCRDWEKTFQFHKSITINNMPVVDIPISHNQTSQYVAIVQESNVKQRLSICEIEVFGKKDYGRQPIVKPDFPKSNGIKPVRKSIGARKVILDGITELTVFKYPAEVYVVKENAESIIFHDKSQKSIVTASKVGKGKMIMFGHQQWLDYIRKENTKFFQQMMHWLMNPDYKLVELAHMDSNEVGGNNLVILWNPRKWRQQSKKKQQLAIRLLKEGKISVIVTFQGFWLNHETLEIRELLRDAGVYVSKATLLYSDATLKVGGELPISGAPLQYNLRYALYNPKAITEMAGSYDAISKLPSYYIRPITKNILDVIEHFRSYVELNVPCLSHCISDSTLKKLFIAYNKLLLMPHLPGVKAPGVDIFPGDVIENERNYVTQKLTVTGTVKETYHPTGLYLPAGATLTTQIISGNPDDWKIRIGCHTDDHGGLSRLVRFPIVTMLTSLKENNVSSPFGGLVWLYNTKEKSSLEVVLGKVIRSPYFDARDPDRKNLWTMTRYSKAPWADIAGDSLAFCMSSKEVRSLEISDLETLMVTYWDTVTKKITLMSQYSPRETKRRIVSLDLVSRYGEAHSGYPIVVPYYWKDSMCKFEKIKTVSNWGMIHEIGHMFQDARWTPPTFGEVTNNIYDAWIQEHVLGRGVYYLTDFKTAPGRLKKLEKQLDENKPLGAYEKLTIFLQIGNQFGWEMYYRLFKRWKQEITSDKKPSNADGIDLWYYYTSMVTKTNMAPTFEFFNMEVSPRIKQSIPSNYSFFLADDFVTKGLSFRTAVILSKYKNVLRKGKKLVVDPSWSYVRLDEMKEPQVTFKKS